MTSSDAKLQKIQTHFQALTETASSLNASSDEFTKVVGILDEALKKLNVGLTVWVTYLTWAEEPPNYSHDQIGYSKVNNKWGIALRRVFGDEALGEEGQEGPWSFNDAPREMRLHGVDKLPELIEALDSEAAKTVNKIKEKTESVRNIAAAVTGISKAPKTAATHTIHISQGQVEAIIRSARESQKFVAELLEHAYVWERRNGELRIRFPFEKKAFAELLEGRETISRVTAVVNQILEPPMKVMVSVEPARFPREADRTQSGTEKEGK
jgi:hypothetical protein